MLFGRTSFKDIKLTYLHWNKGQEMGLTVAGKGVNTSYSNDQLQTQLNHSYSSTIATNLLGKQPYKTTYLAVAMHQYNRY